MAEGVSWAYHSESVEAMQRAVDRALAQAGSARLHAERLGADVERLTKELKESRQLSRELVRQSREPSRDAASASARVLLVAQQRAAKRPREEAGDAMQLEGGVA